MNVKNLVQIAFLLILFASVSIPLFAEDPFGPNEGLRRSFRFSCLPVGTYAYAAHPDKDSIDLFGGEFHEVGLQFEYRPWNMFGIEVYGDIKGYLYDAYGSYPGYEESEVEFVRIWGNPNFSIGVGFVWHFLSSLSTFDLSLSYGIEYIHYFASEVDYYPGIGMSSRVAFLWKPVSWFGFGIVGAAHYSDHPGGPMISNPENSWFDFELAELAAGLTCSFYF